MILEQQLSTNRNQMEFCGIVLSLDCKTEDGNRHCVCLQLSFHPWTGMPSSIRRAFDRLGTCGCLCPSMSSHVVALLLTSPIRSCPIGSPSFDLVCLPIIFHGCHRSNHKSLLVLQDLS